MLGSALPFKAIRFTFTSSPDCHAPKPVARNAVPVLLTFQLALRRWNQLLRSGRGHNPCPRLLEARCWCQGGTLGRNFLQKTSKIISKTFSCSCNISMLIKNRRNHTEKISTHKRCVYESVDDRSPPYLKIEGKHRIQRFAAD